MPGELFDVDSSPVEFFSIGPVSEVVDHGGDTGLDEAAFTSSSVDGHLDSSVEVDQIG